MPRVSIDLSDDAVTGYLRDLAAARGWTLADACYIVLHTGAEDRLAKEQRLLTDHTGPELLAAADSYFAEPVPPQRGLRTAIQELRAAGGDAWDAIEDPKSYLGR